MPGVIGKNSEGSLLYETRPLENVSMKVKRIGAFLLSLHIILVISIIPIIIWLHNNEKEPTSNKNIPPEWLAIFGLSICMIESFFLLLISYFAYNQCCTTQEVYCGMPRQKVGSFSVVLLIVGTLQVLCSLFSGASISLKIGVIVYCVSTNLGGIGSLYFSKSFCQCKTCLGLKDVKLIYKSEIGSITERQEVTSRNLQEWFEFTLAQGTRLAIQIKNGEIIYEFTRQNWRVQLHAGEYIIREIRLLMNPVVSSSIAQPERSTRPRSVRPEITSADETEECSIMNID